MGILVDAFYILLHEFAVDAYHTKYVWREG